MKKLWALVVAMVFGMGMGLNAHAATKAFPGKKVLYVDSYHEGYAWSDGITSGVKKGLEGTQIELKIVRMDTKRNNDEEFKKQAGAKAKAAIEEFKPDLVIVSDDNAAKYVLMDYFRDASLPFVFCGLNWDASLYGLPYKNATGMVEISPIPQILEQVQVYAKGKRIGFIGPDNETARKEAENYKKVFKYELIEYYAKDFEDWKKGFVEMQNKADLLLLESDGGLYKDHLEEMKTLVETSTKIPTGAAYDFMAPFALITYAKIAEEQGYWSADAALKILEGTSPTSIPIAQNKDGQLFLNARIAKSLGVTIPYTLLQSASQVIE